MKKILLGSVAAISLILAICLIVGWRQFSAPKRKWRKFAHTRMEAHDAYLKSIRKATDEEKKDLPNVVIIMMDDLGWGDISAFGSTVIKTPHIDRLAESGITMTNSLAASPICTPSRFGLLTGRYPSRGLINGVYFPSVHPRRVEAFDMGYVNDGAIAGLETPPEHKVTLMPGIVYDLINASVPTTGILEDEITLAEALKARGYETALFGKWHLGDTENHLPNDKGFDYFYGAHYSNDMVPYHIWRNREIVMDGVVDQTRLTKQLTGKILDYIETSGDEPFFIYYPSPWPHHPANASEEFRGRSMAGLYGDCVEETDWSVGRIIEKLKETGEYDNTIIVFTSDNGPWFQGSPGGHRGRKGNTYDGGMAVPTIVSWENRIPGGRISDEMIMNIDYLPTIFKAAGIPLPEDRIIDGRDIMPLLTGESERTPHDELFYVMDMKARAYRDNSGYKYYGSCKSENAKYSSIDMHKIHPYLFNTKLDRDESYDLRQSEPLRAEAMRNRLAGFNREISDNPRGWTDSVE